MDAQKFSVVTEEYFRRYHDTLSRIWPTMGDNGFNEHNQTASFIAAYERIAEKNHDAISSWYEFQIQNGNTNNNRIDGLMVDHTNKIVYLIEAKRFSENEMEKRRFRLGEDYVRILSLDIETRFDQLFCEQDTIADYRFFGVLLFDLWVYEKAHKAEREAFSIWSKFCEQRDVLLLAEFLRLEQKNNAERVKDNFLATIREVKSYAKSKYNLGILAFQVK